MAVLIVALAVAERFVIGEKFVSVSRSVCTAVSQRVNQDPPLLLLSTLCTSFAFRQGLFGWFAIGYSYKRCPVVVWRSRLFPS